LGLAYFIHRADRATHERVQLAERLGFQAAYVTQLAGRDSLTVLAAYAAKTERIRLGAGIAPIYTRTPAAMAQAAATLDESSDGRFNLGLGVSDRFLIEAWHGQTIEDPVAEMREYVSIVRAILRGEPPPEGARWRTSFRFAGMDPRPDIPFYLAALSPRMLRLAGEVADGAILWLCDPDYVREVAVPAIAAGREAAGKPREGFDLVAGLFAAVTDDVESAYRGMRRRLRSYFMAPFYRATIRRAGFGDEVDAFDEAGGDPDRQRAAISERFLHAVTLTGEETTVQERLRGFREAGVDTPCIGPVGEDDSQLDATLTALAALEPGRADALRTSV
jgi:alkanesulfonate monooxygenase SsuD/methylene tetrahydromethanopterin reductase-like flavin-dependent oxidoreductase (luciferase family)